MRQTTMAGKNYADSWADQIAKQMREEIDNEIMKGRDWYDEGKIYQDIWISPTEKEKIEIEGKNKEYQKDIEDMMRKARQTSPDPVDKLREEMREELSDIKKAIRKIGVMLDGDAPSEKMLEKHKTLRDAYRKYKMIEALILGQQE